jgi:RNA-directed DNA polymerase
MAQPLRAMVFPLAAPVDPQVHYGITDRDFLDVHDVQMDLLPGKLHELRWKLNQKAKKEPKRVYIPKADGSKRPLGIPTLKDRVAQMAVVLILEPIFEADFLDCSHGFRRGRKAHGRAGRNPRQPPRRENGSL